ncbi:hypothetical protein AruPA_00760 [Acidiphilium sp. PA]|uniref:hypothetical protein n=1 Tax=Acidiphilium sp. PA TaxID=2871705 RepID=UPI002242CC36|nr:hypothetical protein [Acidiphilium sp. PA]MCW8305553.1 hypothetical protein [Acidiphilium sp. PA]
MDVAAAQAPPPLHDLLGASFVFNTTINALVWDGDAAVFGLADGALACLASLWQGAPRLAPRPGGGIEIIAAAAPPPPPVIIGAHRAATLSLAADPLGGVVSGGADGRFLRLAEGGVTELAARARRQINAVAAGRGGRRAFAAGRQVDQLGPDQKRLSLPGPVVALCFDPSGLHLAIGYEGGVSLEACAVRAAPRFEAPGAFRVICWDAEGARFAAAVPGGGVVMRDRAGDAWRIIDIPMRATAMGFTSEGVLVIGGDEDVYVWDATGGARRFAIGRDGRQAVGPIACHPRLGLVACADRAGRVVLGRPGLRDVMLIREAGSAPVALEFTPSGAALAFATVDGEAGTVLLPDLLFRPVQGGRGEMK